MAEAMVKGLLKTGFPAASITCSDAYTPRLEYMAKEVRALPYAHHSRFCRIEASLSWTRAFLLQQCGINTTASNLEVVGSADVVVLAVPLAIAGTS